MGGAAVKDRDDEDSDPLDPRLMSSRKEPDLKPPDRREVWRAIRKEAELEGDFNIVQRLHSALACPVISVFGFGLGSPHTSNLLSSVMKSYALCLRDCKTLAQLTSTQRVMWMGFWGESAQQKALERRATTASTRGSSSAYGSRSCRRMLGV